jgi:hypothetical protein
MFIACWSVKGGSGTTVVAAALALLLAETSSGGALLADLGGDAPAVLGMPEPSGPGLAQWLASGDDVAADALARLEVPVSPSLRLLPYGVADAAPGSGRAGALLAALSVGGDRTVVADCGSPVGLSGQGAGAALAGGADLSLLVIRPCYLALRRALAAPLRPSGIVFVAEGGRCLGRGDVEDVLGVPVRAEVPVDTRIARAVDAGLLAGHVPPSLLRSLRSAA